jgi:hypothetical protein
VNHLNADRSDYAYISFIGHIPARFECISHPTRLYLKKLKELKKLKHHRHVSLASTHVFNQAVRQVNGWEYNRYQFVSSPDIPAS